MKKFLATILLITLILSMPMVLTQETTAVFASPINRGAESNILSTKGEIKEIREGKVSVVGEGAYNEIVLNIQDSTYILNGLDGTQIPLEDLKKGDAITVYYGPSVTRSIPPQGNAIALIVGTTQTGSTGMYMQVAKVEEEKDGSIRVLSTNGDKLITIRPEVFAQTADINEGSELIVWYGIMTMSIPAQATATKAVLLSNDADIRVDTTAGSIVTKSGVAVGALNATYSLGKESITLVNGLFEKNAAPGSSTVNRTQVWDKPVIGDLNADNVADAALCLINSPGGSGTFYYIAAYVKDSQTQNYKGTNAILLGDRIQVSEISIENNIITVVYNDRNPNEAMSATPTVAVSRKFVVDNGSLKEMLPAPTCSILLPAAR